jgi:hypothetical protein
MVVIASPRLRTAVAALLVAGSAALMAAPVLADQSLADVAKKEEARRKAAPAATVKVYTNKDLSPVPAGSPVPAPPPAAAAPKAGADVATEAKDTPEKQGRDAQPIKDQAYWSGRLKALKDKLDRDMSFADALQTKVNSLAADFVNRDDPAQRAVIERDRQKALAQLAALQKDIATDKKAIADLQEDARRAGVPPGWLR